MLINNINRVLDELLIGNDNLIEIFNLFNESTKKFINDATITITMKDKAGVVVLDTGSGSIFPAPANFIPNSNGNYQGVIPQNAALTEGHRYTIEITAIQTSTGVDGFWTLNTIASVRRT